MWCDKFSIKLSKLNFETLKKIPKFEFKMTVMEIFQFMEVVIVNQLEVKSYSIKSFANELSQHSVVPYKDIV